MDKTTPQLENGYTQIANEIMDILCTSMPGGAEGQILLFLLRKTYGFHKTEDSISISQIVTATGKSKRMVIYALQNLEAKKMIKIFRSKKSPFQNNTNKISFNKNHSEWLVQEVAQGYEKELHRKLKKNKVVVQEVAQGVVQETVIVRKMEKEVVQLPVIPLPKVAQTKDIYTIKDKEKNKKEKFVSSLINQEISYEYIYNVAVKLNIMPVVVIKLYFEILDMLKQGSFKSKWGDHMNLILQGWLRRRISEGQIQTNNEFETAKLPLLAPDKGGKDLWQRALASRKETTI